jgi:c-di-GMP-binding flagellar brake protein YcgR
VFDRRKYPRVNTTNLISHVTIDETGRWIFQGMSRTLDISRGGILLETAYPIESGCLSMMTVDMDNNLIEIKGKLIHCSKSDTTMYHSGIKFIGADEQITKFVTQMIKVFNHRKNNVLIAWSNNRLKESAAVG